jgi:hypothetical protein
MPIQQNKMRSWVWLKMGVFELAGAILLIHLRKLVGVNVIDREWAGVSGLEQNCDVCSAQKEY